MWGLINSKALKLFPYSDLQRKQTHYLCYYNYPTHKPHTHMQLQLEAISLPGLLQANYIFPGSTKLLSLYYVSFLSDAPETEKPSASHFICGDICYSLGNYYSHPGFTAHSQAAVFLSLSTMKSEFLCLRKTCGTSAKNYRNPEKWEPKWTTSKAFLLRSSSFTF